MLANSQDIIKFNTLLNRIGIADMKREMIFRISEGRTTSTKELTRAEIITLIDNLNNRINPVNDFDANRKRKLIKKILHICHLLGWYVEDTTMLDYKKIDMFCVTRGHAHVRLLEHDYDELIKLLYQFEKVLETNVRP